MSVPLNFILEIFSKIVQFSAEIPISQINVIKLHIASIIVYYIIVIFVRYIFILRRKKNLRRIEKNICNLAKKITKKRLISIILIIFLILKITELIPSNLKIHMIDVGQGDCTLIQTEYGKTIMIDSGGQEDLDKYDVGKQVIVPYLLARRITKLDYIMISHFHADHCNGFIAVMNEIKIGAIIMAKQETETVELKRILEVAKENNVKIIYAKQGQKIKLDNLTDIEIMYIGKDTKNLNNNSIIARLTYKTFSMIFTGDAEKEEEDEFLKSCGNKSIKADILKIGHHGSKTSSSDELIKRIIPQIALIGVGNNNKFGHPNEEVIDRLKSINAKIYRTDLMGEITVEVNHECKIKVKTQIE